MRTSFYNYGFLLTQWLVLLGSATKIQSAFNVLPPPVTGFVKRPLTTGQAAFRAIHQVLVLSFSLEPSADECAVPRRPRSTQLTWSWVDQYNRTRDDVVMPEPERFGKWQSRYFTASRQRSLQRTGCLLDCMTLSLASWLFCVSWHHFGHQMNHGAAHSCREALLSHVYGELQWTL
ncbi:hypothetical protein FMEXI_5706 [Fusarium mexicanum]|uniref:Secreted protein n=1 Tax=Fusarium mexicanum TaxID=751941 RepID=A0A8H5J0Q8_9HYPO|nr:hypothetical protein FMEXI_5706 [Fusarium mexicanum]